MLMQAPVGKVSMCLQQNNPNCLWKDVQVVETKVEKYLAQGDLKGTCELNEKGCTSPSPSASPTMNPTTSDPITTTTTEAATTVRLCSF
jgi:hypothetical protein